MLNSTVEVALPGVLEMEGLSSGQSVHQFDLSPFIAYLNGHFNTALAIFTQRITGQLYIF